MAQEVDKYKVTGPHVELAKKMMARDPATAPNVGDRIPYVMIKVGPQTGNILTAYNPAGMQSGLVQEAPITWQAAYFAPLWRRVLSCQKDAMSALRCKVSMSPWQSCIMADQQRCAGISNAHMTLSAAGR